MITFEQFKEDVKHLDDYKVELTWQSNISKHWNAKVTTSDNVFTNVFIKYLFKNDLGFIPHEGWIEIY